MNGKGSRNRTTDHQAFRGNYAKIRWHRPKTDPEQVATWKRIFHGEPRWGEINYTLKRPTESQMDAISEAILERFSANEE